MINAELRRQGISSTDVGPICGLDDRRDGISVWLHKKGLMPDMEPTVWMRLGKHLEQGIMSFYSELTSRPMEWCDTTYQHATEDWMLASPDAVNWSERRGCDSKLVLNNAWGASPDDVPLSIQAQMHWMMAVMNFDRWDVCAVMSRETPRIYEYQRDAEAEECLIQRMREWHQRFILGDEEPPITGSFASTEWLKRVFPKNRGKVRVATAAEAALLEDYTAVRVSELELTARRALLENQIRKAVGEDDGIAWPGGKFTWKRTKDSTKVDWEMLAETLLLSRAPEERAELLKPHTLVIPGYRRIYFMAGALRDAKAAHEPISKEEMPNE